MSIKAEPDKEKAPGRESRCLCPKKESNLTTALERPAEPYFCGLSGIFFPYSIPSSKPGRNVRLFFVRKLAGI
jgi:hypothetical protein